MARSADDRVELRIEAFSRPSTWLVRLGGPVGRRVQDRITDRYLAAAVGSVPDSEDDARRHPGRLRRLDVDATTQGGQLGLWHDEEVRSS